MQPDPLPTPLADDLWIIKYPLHILGANFGRNTTILRLNDALLIHSSAPFSDTTASAINTLGSPTWAIEATLFHDSFTSQFTSRWPALPLFAPEGFKAPNITKVYPLNTTPADWKNQLDVLKIEGVPQSNEYALFHRPSRTLIIADIIFNLSPASGLWTRILLRSLSGLKPEPGISRLFRMIIKDHAAFTRSIARLMEWDFERVIVGHGDVIACNGKQVLSRLWQKNGFLP